VFGGHLPELLIVLILALVVFGPKRLPEIGGAMGKGIKEFRKGTAELEDKTSAHDASSTVAARPVSPPQQGETVTTAAPAPEEPTSDQPRPASTDREAS
jgi:TatA/E family protein of Tat protein translocase